MQMLDIYPRYESNLVRRGLSCGFSLLELLVVLSLLALVTSLALPNLSKMYNSFSSALQMDEVVRQINGIGYQVHNQRQEYWFRDIVAKKAIQARSGIDVHLPEGWSLVVEKPFRYAENGACMGGFVRIFFEEELLQTVQLEAPFCQVNL